MAGKEDTLWSAPESVTERLQFKQRNTEWTEFMMCGIYCIVAVFFLIVFGIAAVSRGEIPYATVIFGFAVATCVVYGGIWISGEYYLARHFVVALMAALCLYLFYSGGTDNTGPLYYFIFPIVALYLQGIERGSFSVICLFLVTLIIHSTGWLGFDIGRYDFFFISRVYTVYVIVSILAYIFAWFRERAERELLLSLEDLANIAPGDLLTGLANSRFMERLMDLEYSRFMRYGSHFCLMAIKVDDMDRKHRQHGTEFCNVLMSQLAELLLRNLRRVDIPARWNNEQLLVMLPETRLGQAMLLAERFREKVGNHHFNAGSITISIGISEIEEELADAVKLAENNLHLAERDQGDKIVSGKQAGRAKFRGLERSFDQPE